MKNKCFSNFTLARYETGNYVEKADGLYFRDGEKVKCEWRLDRTGMALVDQRRFAHQFSNKTPAVLKVGAL